MPENTRCARRKDARRGLCCAKDLARDFAAARLEGGRIVSTDVRALERTDWQADWMAEVVADMKGSDDEVEDCFVPIVVAIGWLMIYTR